jgi:hypothetical protein
MGEDRPEYVKRILSSMFRTKSKEGIESVKDQLETMMLSQSHHRRRWALAFLTVVAYGLQGASVIYAAGMAKSMPVMEDEDIEAALAFGKYARQYPSLWDVLKKSAQGAWPALQSAGNAIFTFKK